MITNNLIILYMNYNIIKIFCNHGNYGATPPYQCDIICDSIIEAFNNKCKLDLDKLLEYLGKLFSGYNYRGSTCVNANKEKIKELINNIFEIMPTIFFEMHKERTNIFLQILRFPYYDTCYEHLNKNVISLELNGKIIFNAFLNALESRMSSNYLINNDILANFIIKNVDMNFNVIERLITCKSEVLAQYIANIIDKSNDDFTKNDLLLKASSALPYSKPIIQSLVFKGCKITNNHVKRVISDCSADSIDFILELSGIKATKIHYKYLLEARKDQETEIDKRDTTIQKKVHLMLNKSYTIYKSGFTKSYSPEKMEVLIKHGFIPDKDDINLSITSNKEIYNIERFGIVLDETFLKLCQEYKFYPNYNFKCIDQNLYQLQNLCSNKNLPKIKQFMKKNKVIPDSVCMENAAKVPNNKETLEILVNAGGIINKSCLLAYTNILYDNQLNFLMQEYFKSDTK